MIDLNKNEKVEIHCDKSKPLIAMAFKITDEQYGQFTYTRIYQGTLTKGGTYFNPRMNKSQRIGRIVRMHADKREEIESAEAGDIVAVMGVDAASGDTYAAENKYCTLENMFVPEPVIKMSITPTNRDGLDNRLENLQVMTAGDHARLHAKQDGTINQYGHWRTP